MLDKRKLQALKLVFGLMVIFLAFHFGLSSLMSKLVERFK